MEFTDDSSEENPDEKRRTQQSGELRYAYSEGGYVQKDVIEFDVGKQNDI